MAYCFQVDVVEDSKVSRCHINQMKRQSNTDVQRRRRLTKQRGD